MADRRSAGSRPGVADARALGRRDDLDRIVILFQRGDEVGYCSYGRDREACQETKRLADILYGEMFDWVLYTQEGRIPRELEPF